MELVVAHHGMQRGMLKDGVPSDIEHGIGAIHPDNFCLRVAQCKSDCDIGGPQPKIENMLAAEGIEGAKGLRSGQK
jgi:hypothetical protein